MSNRTAFSLRRVSAILFALVAVVVAGLLVATDRLGRSVWPPGAAEDAMRLASDPAAVETALGAGDAAKPLRIGIVGDIQNGVPELMDLVRSYGDAPVDLFLQLGDAANEGEPARYAVLRHVFRELAPGVPLLAVPGNHDIEPEQTTRVWTHAVGPAEWRIDVRGWRILGIDDAAGTISEPSMELLRRAAADGEPANGTILVVHRPLAATTSSDGVAARARQLASTGLVPTLVFAGHYHTNEEFGDVHGTVHHLLGENCDRSSAGADAALSRAVLTLGPGNRHELLVTKVPRRAGVAGEFLRLLVGHVYPSFRDRTWLLWTLVAAALGAAWLALRATRPASAAEGG